MQIFKLLQTKPLQLNEETRLIKAADYLDYQEAETIITVAQQRAQAIEQTAEQKRDEVLQQAYQEGQQKAQQEQIEQSIAMAGRSIDYFSNIEKQVTNIVMTAVRRILGEFDDVDLVVRSVRNVLHTMGNEKQLSLRVANQHAETVKARVTEILSAYPAVSFIEVIGDNRLAGTACVLESEMGVVEASVEVQMQSLQNALQEHFNAQKEGQ